jgi:hypothetical protein
VFDAITALNHNTMLICFQKFIIEQNVPLGLHDLTLTVSHKLFTGAFSAGMLGSEVFERIQKL